jgi:hypothetical protein
MLKAPNYGGNPVSSPALNYANPVKKKPAAKAPSKAPVKAPAKKKSKFNQKKFNKVKKQVFGMK